MEEELESLVRFLLRKEAGADGAGSGGEHALGLPKDQAEAARLLATLRSELDAAETGRRAKDAEARDTAAR